MLTSTCNYSKNYLVKDVSTENLHLIFTFKLLIILRKMIQDFANITFVHFSYSWHSLLRNHFWQKSEDHCARQLTLQLNHLFEHPLSILIYGHVLMIIL